MAAVVGQRPGCSLERTFKRLNSGSSGPGRTRVCKEALFLISLHRYGKDPDFGIFFPESIHVSDSLFDATLTDGDCRIRASLDPSLNRLIHKNELRCGCLVRNVVFTMGWESEGDRHVHVSHLDVDIESGGDAALHALSVVNVKTLPWFGSEPSLLPLRARRSAYLPLWNNHDFTGEMWRDTLPSGPAESDSGDELEVGPSVSLRELRRRFLAGSRRARGVLLVRILHKSRLMYYGKAEQHCECPYKAELCVCDGSASVCVVLWNSMCCDWYRSLQPGQVLRLSRYRVKESYESRSGQNPQPDIEISLNSRNPSAGISILPASRLSAEWSLPALPHSFLCGRELLNCPNGNICDVIGLVIYTGRQERIKSKDGPRTELVEYRWLRLEDGTSDQPIIIKLFSTSQPDIQSRIQPMALLVCTRLQLVRSSVDRAATSQYLTNTRLTQVYCTGTSPRPVMPYKGIRPVKQFLQWLKQTDESDMLDSALIGGYFTYPPLPVSLQHFMDDRKGELGLISGQELKLETVRLQYRETRCFTIQTTITSVCYHTREDDGRMQCSDSPASAQLSPRISRQRDGSRPFRAPKRRLNSTSTPRKRLLLPLQQSVPEDDAESEFSLFDGAMEFLVGEEDDDDDEGDEGFITPPTSPASPRLGLARVDMETVPRSFCYPRRYVQALAVGMQTNSFHKLLPERELESFSPAPCYSGHYTLTLKALSDGVMLNVLFIPTAPGNRHWKSLPLPHANTWHSVLSHGGFSPETPPPSPADLIATATHLTNQRLVCVLEACALGGDRVELVLSRAYSLRS